MNGKLNTPAVGRNEQIRKYSQEAWYLIDVRQLSCSGCGKEGGSANKSTQAYATILAGKLNGVVSNSRSNVGALASRPVSPTTAAVANKFVGLTQVTIGFQLKPRQRGGFAAESW